MAKGRFVFLVLLLAAAGARGAEDPVVAVVDGEKVLRSELEAAQMALPEQFRQLPLETIWDPLLSRVIDRRLLAREAERRRLHERPEAKAAIERARREILGDFLLESVVAESLTPERLEQAYRIASAQPGFAVEEVRARHILLGSEAEARGVLAELAKGADFATLAQSRSLDPSAKENKGDLGFFRREAMVEPFAEAAFSAEPGTTLADPVRTRFGWHVIRVEERRSVLPTLEEKRAELEERLAREAINGLVAELRARARVERFGPDKAPRAN
ncbi:MAG: peptidylprolyl isomerase [Geminicoccaceae bacterium]|nr:peptidylprolyl isomerase [Geminicoccaceae bacterium]MCS7268898.1 peptidylprolyl isomerase [Geminicoccaceae bacterium]MCX7629567.1 peptidylprolyl isomerase [Geminicoccaceae bacterium]MDW8125184.1 peptidylprolyl isomerase [Geminicoccaceae bacterium]MDW8342004.1 peptidylprolyl isomerase [Geminicoccaceae bacterium]